MIARSGEFLHSQVSPDADARAAFGVMFGLAQDFVTLAVGDPDGDRVQLLRLSKQDFIRKDAEVAAVSSLGETLQSPVTPRPGSGGP